MLTGKERGSGNVFLLMTCTWLTFCTSMYVHVYCREKYIYFQHCNKLYQILNSSNKWISNVQEQRENIQIKQGVVQLHKIKNK